MRNSFMIGENNSQSKQTFNTINQNKPKTYQNPLLEKE